MNMLQANFSVGAKFTTMITILIQANPSKLMQMLVFLHTLNYYPF